MDGRLTVAALPTVRIREPDTELTLDEQLRIFEEWALWMFYLSCSPLEH